MALGGGVFTTQNKKLPGSYINFVSAERASATLGDRGVCAVPMELNWGPDSGVLTLSNEDFINRSQKILGYDYSHEYCKPFREIFKNAKLAYIAVLNNSPVRAENEFCTAKYGGIRGNDIKIIITNNVDEPTTFDVKTLLDNLVMDEQKKVTNTSELKDNDLVEFKKGVPLTLTANTPLTGGVNGQGVKAQNTYAEAVSRGPAGNDITIAISADEPIVEKEAVKAANKYAEAISAGAEGNKLSISITRGAEYEAVPAKAAENKYATAKVTGPDGDKLQIVIQQGSAGDKFNVTTLQDGYHIETQEDVASTDDLKDNNFVTFKKGQALSVEEVALEGGADAVMANYYVVTTLNGSTELDKQEQIKSKEDLQDNTYVKFTKTAEFQFENEPLTGGADAVISPRYIVTTKVMGDVKDTQSNIAAATELVDNPYVTFFDAAELTLGEFELEGGAESLSVMNWQRALDTLEGYSFNTLGIPSNDDLVKGLAAAYTKRLRDDVGVKFQTVVFNYAADEKGVINVVNGLSTDDKDPSVVYWTTGAQCGCKVYESLTNVNYTGEYDLDILRTQTQLAECVDKGQFVFHKVGDDVRVLTDINSKTTVDAEESEDFKSNQTMRVLDQIGNDIASIFNDRYLGKIPNDAAGRTALWNDIVKHHQELARLRAIDAFDSADVSVGEGNDKRSVVVNDKVTPTNALEKLYMTCVVA